MTPRRPFGPLPRGAALLAAALALGACVYDPPIGPPTVLVTVAPWPDGPDAHARLAAAFSKDAEQGRVKALAVDFAGADTWTAGATLIGRCAVGDVAQGFVPGARETIAERFSNELFECGAFLSGELFDEQRGLLQGCVLHDESWLRAAAGADAGPLGAMAAGVQFVALRGRRPTEDTPFVWVHLDLTDAVRALDAQPVGDAGATLDEALAGLAEELAQQRGHTVALVGLSGAAAGTAALATGAGPTLEAGAAPVALLAADFGDFLWQARAAAEVAP